MTKQIPLTIATSIYQLPIEQQTRQLWQLTHQTVLPLEIIVISASPDSQYRAMVREALSKFDLVRVIDAPQYGDFGSSRCANIAIKQSSPASQFVSFIEAGLLFNETSVEAIGEQMDSNAICEAQMALLPADYEIGDIETLWDRWDDLVNHLDAYSRTLTFAPGSLMCMSRDRYFEIRGFDETNYPMAYNDSDLHRRVRLAGLQLKVIPWGKMQMVHIIHERRYPLPAYPDGHETNIIANGENWGVIE